MNTKLETEMDILNEILTEELMSAAEKAADLIQRGIDPLSDSEYLEMEALCNRLIKAYIAEKYPEIGEL